MNLSQKYDKIIRYTGSEKDVEKYEKIIAAIEDSKLKNIAVLGENNSGKTSLINRLAGTEVRKPSKISLDEQPLMVTFAEKAEKENFECVKVDSGKLVGSSVALYELPIDGAVNGETNTVSDVLESMDAVIYVISAIMPFTRTDLEALRAIANRFPVIIWISKADLFDVGREYNDCKDYIKKVFADNFKDVEVEFFDGTDGAAVDKVIDILKDFDPEELRGYHVLQIDQFVKNMLIDKLKIMLADAKSKLKSDAQTKQDDRRTQLQWNNIRLTMMEKEQDAVDAANKRICISRIAVKQKAAEELKKAKNKKQWITNNLKPFLEEEMRKTILEVFDDVCELSSVHAEWLMGEVNRTFGKKMTVEQLNSYLSSAEAEVGDCNAKMDYKHIGFAAGSGAVALGSVAIGTSLAVILSYYYFIPTVILAVSASLLTALFVKGGLADYEKYNDNLSRFVSDCCESNYNQLSAQIREETHRYYENIIEKIVTLSGEKTQDNNGEAAAKVSEIETMIRSLAEA